MYCIGGCHDGGLKCPCTGAEASGGKQAAQQAVEDAAAQQAAIAATKAAVVPATPVVAAPAEVPGGVDSPYSPVLLSLRRQQRQ